MASADGVEAEKKIDEANIDHELADHPAIILFHFYKVTQCQARSTEVGRIARLASSIFAHSLNEKRFEG